MKPQTKPVTEQKKHTGLKLLLVMLLLIMAALTILPFFINPIAETLVKGQIRELFGDKLKIGSVHVSLWTGATVTIRQIQLAQPPGYRQGDLIKADAINIRVALRPLLK